MNFTAVYHRTSDNYCYPLNNDDLIINIKTGYDVERVVLCYGDPFTAGILGSEWKWIPKEEEIYFKKRLKYQLWWTTTVKPEYKRCRYYFKLYTKDEVYCYFEDGFYSEEDMKKDGKSYQCFTFPWLNSIDVAKTPDWVNEAIWYQIFPERFCNGDESINPENVKQWHSNKIVNEEYYGGDLRGIINKLDYLEDLGITALYLTPIFEAPSIHKYDTKDYFEIDPHFGTKEDFRELMEKAHKKGIRVMLDGVFNHCGVEFFAWKDVLENGLNSKYFDWFMINKFPFPEDGDTQDKRYYSFAFTPAMPKLNTNNEEVANYFLSVIKYWIEEFDIDGFRLDVANELSHDFCKKLHKLVKKLKPDFYLLGEIWHDSICWLRGDEFDSVMNYPLQTGIHDFWIYENRTKQDFEYSINHYYTMYMQQTNNVLFNLLDSHDTNRLFNRVKNNIDIFYQQLAILYTMPGSPCIYYGTEVALDGEHDPDCRRCMPWEDIEQGKYDERIAQVKTLIKLRKSYPEFRSKHFHFTEEYENKRVIEYIKLDDFGNKIQVLLNCSQESVEVKLEDILYSHKLNGNILESNGILIQKI